MEATHKAQTNDYKVAVISGDIPQRKRMRILEDFKAGKLQFLVATDVAWKVADVGRQSTGIKRLKHRRFIHNATTREIQEHRTFPQLRETFSVDQTFGILSHRDMDRNKIRTSE